MPCRMAAVFGPSYNTVSAGILKILTYNKKVLFGNLIFIEKNTVSWNTCFEICEGIELVEKVTPTPHMCQLISSPNVYLLQGRCVPGLMTHLSEGCCEYKITKEMQTHLEKKWKISLFQYFQIFYLIKNDLFPYCLICYEQIQK